MKYVVRAYNMDWHEEFMVFEEEYDNERQARSVYENLQNGCLYDRIELDEVDS